MKQFTAEYVNEAIEQLQKLEKPNQKKVIKAVAIFEQVGIEYKNINDLENGGIKLFSLLVGSKIQRTI